MRRQDWTALLLVVLVPLAVAAQPAATPAVPPTPGPNATSDASRWIVEGGVLVGTPRGTFADTPSSHGWMVMVGLRVAPHLEVLLGYRTLPIHFESAPRNDGLHDAPIYFHHSEVLVALRYAVPLAPGLMAFGEAQLGRAMFRMSSTDFAGGDDTVNSAGVFGLRAGILGVVRRRFGIGAAAGVSTAKITLHGVSILGQQQLRDSWLTLDAFVRVGF